MSASRAFIIIIQMLQFLFHTVAQQQYPAVSCPDIFQYSYDPSMGGYFGLINVKRDGSATSELIVNMTMNTQVPVNNNIKIVVLSKQDELFNGNSIRYAIRFPVQNVVPKLTQVQFNGKILCRAEPDPLEPGVIQTLMWAKSTVTTFSESVQTQPTTQKPLYMNPQFFLTFGAAPRPFDLPSNSFLPTNNKQDETAPPQQATSTVRPIVSETERTVDKCGITSNSQNLIVGGEGVRLGDFPWLAAVMYRQKSNYKFHCTGNLISDKHILTAGHCVKYHNAPLFDNEDLIIILGKLNIENWASGGTIKNAKIVVAHPNYKQDTADFDVAIIVMNEPVRFKATVRPICLWSGSQLLDGIIGKSGTVVGWSKQSDDESPSSVAQKIEMPVVSQENCLRSNKVFKKYTSTRTFCAGNRDNSSGPCVGDSGAGFMMQDESTKKWFLRGLVGFSIRNPETLACDLNHYAIFIDIAKIRSWIEEEVKRN